MMDNHRKGDTMLYRYLTGVALAGLLAVPLTAGAADSTAPASAPKLQKAQEQIYGSQLMTRQERLEHRAKLRAAKTAEEREQIRKEHHERMQQRAKERGVSLPEMPPKVPGGGGMGPAGGMRPGPNR